MQMRKEVGTTYVEGDIIDDTWQYVFADMPMYDAQGREIDYSIKESSTSESYHVRSISGDRDYGFAIVNTIDGMPIEMPVTGGEGVPPWLITAASGLIIVGFGLLLWRRTREESAIRRQRLDALEAARRG